MIIKQAEAEKSGKNVKNSAAATNSQEMMMSRWDEIFFFLFFSSFPFFHFFSFSSPPLISTPSSSTRRTSCDEEFHTLIFCPLPERQRGSKKKNERNKFNILWSFIIKEFVKNPELHEKFIGIILLKNSSPCKYGFFSLSYHEQLACCLNLLCTCSLGALHGVRWRLLLCMLLCVAVGRRESEYMRSHNLFSTCFNSFKILQSYGFSRQWFFTSYIVSFWLADEFNVSFSRRPNDLEVCHIPAFLMWRRRAQQQQWHTFAFALSARHGYQIFSSSMNQGGNGKSHDVKQQQDQGRRERKKVKPKFTHS